MKSQRVSTSYTLVPHWHRPEPLLWKGLPRPVTSLICDCEIQVHRRETGNKANLDIHIACRLVLAAEQSMPCSWLVEDRQRHTARLRARLVHHIPVDRLGVMERKVKT